MMVPITSSDFGRESMISMVVGEVGTFDIGVFTSLGTLSET